MIEQSDRIRGGHVIVIGGTKGLGKICSARFINRGYKVTVLSRSKPEATSDHLTHIETDLETLTDASDIAATATKANGPVQYMIFAQRYRGKDDPWRGEIQVSLTATKLLMEAFADRFAPSGDRAIAIVSSVYGVFAGGSQPLSYHAVKAALNQLVRHGAWTMGRRGVRINSIMPLTYLKPESEHVYLSNKRVIDMYKRLVPLGRMGTAAEAADAIEFLCSEKSSFINGQCIFIDGGVSVLWPEEVASNFVAEG